MTDDNNGYEDDFIDGADANEEDPSQSTGRLQDALHQAEEIDIKTHEYLLWRRQTELSRCFRGDSIVKSERNREIWCGE